VVCFAVRRNARYRNGLCIYHRAVVDGHEDCPITISGESYTDASATSPTRGETSSMGARFRT
jgi:hypothetical protein